jgi:hypothetical protein
MKILDELSIGPKCLIDVNPQWKIHVMGAP